MPLAQYVESAHAATLSQPQTPPVWKQATASTKGTTTNPTRRLRSTINQCLNEISFSRQNNAQEIVSPWACCCIFGLHRNAWKRTVCGRLNYISSWFIWNSTVWVCCFVVLLWQWGEKRWSPHIKVLCSNEARVASRCHKLLVLSGLRQITDSYAAPKITRIRMGCISAEYAL